MSFSDQDLIAEIRSGSNVGFEALMRRYGRLVYRIGYGFTGNRESALDVVQETFLKVHSRLGEFRAEGDLKNWIARIAANEGMNQSRWARRHPTSDLEEDIFLRPDPSQEDQLLERESHSVLHRSLGALSPRQRLAVVLRYFEGLPPREISTVLECSEGTARNILFRSLRKLQTVLTASEGPRP